MKRAFLIFALAIPCPALAGQISTAGTSIEVENYRCTVRDSRSIECLNIGRVCEDYRAKEKARNDASFGCAGKDSPNYPCKESRDDTMKHIKETEADSMACIPMVLGF